MGSFGKDSLLSDLGFHQIPGRLKLLDTLIVDPNWGNERVLQVGTWGSGGPTHLDRDLGRALPYSHLLLGSILVESFIPWVERILGISWVSCLSLYWSFTSYTYLKVGGRHFYGYESTVRKGNFSSFLFSSLTSC